MTRSERNFWRYWTPRVIPLGLVFGLLLGALVLPLAAFTGLAVGLAAAFLAASVTTTIFVVLLGQSKIRAIDRMLSVFPEQARYIPTEHLYEPPVPVRLLFEDDVEATKERLVSHLVRFYATRMTPEGLRVDLREVEMETPNICRVEISSSTVGSRVTVHPDNRVVIGGADTRAQRFYGLIAQLEELDGVLQRPLEAPMTLPA